MADDIVQQVLSLLSQPTALPSSCTDAAANATVTSMGGSATLAGGISQVGLLSPLVTLFLWFSKLPDWLKLLIVGGVVESCRRTMFSFYNRVLSAFFITATFEEDDDAYDWMMIWLSKQPSWNSAREVQISTKSFGLRGEVATVPGEEAGAAALLGDSRTLSYLPAPSTAHIFWYPPDAPWHMRRRITVSRMQRNAGGYYGGMEESLELRILTRSHTTLNRLLLDAKRTHLAEKENKISIYVADINDSWRHVASRPKRALNSIVLDPGIKNLLIDDARDFLESRDWYGDRGIPFRRGYLLYGAPGCGKTSIIHSMAGELGLDVYIISLSRAGMDDTKLSELISELPTKCIALMEDIDAAFTSGVTTRAQDTSATEEPEKNKREGPREDSSPIASRVSLSGLLNALDGVGAQEGRILFATTNHYEKLDPALCRPGRMDVHVEFRLASKYQARELFRHFYAPRHKRDDGRAPEQEKVADSGYNTAPSSDVSSCASEEAAEQCTGQLHHSARLFRMDAAVADALAARFAEAVPERQFSMASLQGYLMGYKIRPQDAVDDVEGWVATQMTDKVGKHAKGATLVDKGAEKVEET
ncbi:P-loop containing nucleoside triphosphate hydrolase protein [Schizophyllum amplum]|uniref:P-loop containing nucleoside triphosphate hydrolase protein n=1 Tax=Schizophyllum amplum TaxID=97359 RepID=A0A550CYK3_9AGAR|nr:P-loop containing nucleoside triphosphate hydrolase protein [Auriculariopsis ampla]